MSLIFSFHRNHFEIHVTTKNTPKESHVEVKIIKFWLLKALKMEI